jgi:hypothetical protein
LVSAGAVGSSPQPLKGGATRANGTGSFVPPTTACRRAVGGTAMLLLLLLK